MQEIKVMDITDAEYDDFLLKRLQAPALDLEPIVIMPIVQTRKDISHGMEDPAIQIDFIRPVDNAQRADSRPAQQVVEDVKADFIEARQDGRGL